MSIDDEIECRAEFIDGSWAYEMCGCPECCEAAQDEHERQVEAGYDENY